METGKGHEGQTLYRNLNRLRHLLDLARIKRIEKDGEWYYEYAGELYPEYLNLGSAMTYILDTAQQYCQGAGLDIGASKWPYPGAIPIQDEEGLNAYTLDRFADEQFDYVFSSHCLEHLEDWQYALGLWLQKIKVSGILFLYLPHHSMKMWHPGAALGGHHVWIPRYQVINKFLEANGCVIVDYNPAKDHYWSFHLVARKQQARLFQRIY